MREEINTERELGLEQKYKTRLFLVRHGESIGNAQRCFLGHTDLDLTEYGYRQAKCTADFLSDIRIDEVYSSSLIRAYNTALPNAAMRSLTVKRSDMLRESPSSITLFGHEGTAPYFFSNSLLHVLQ